MASIEIIIYTAPLFEGWSQSDIDGVDMSATEAKIEGAIRDRVISGAGVEDVIVEVRGEDRGDTWTISDVECFAEQRDLDYVVRSTLIDFPWYDRDVWAVPA